MKFATLSIVVVLFILIGCSSNALSFMFGKNNDNEVKWTNNINIVKNGVEIKWSNEDDEWLVMEVSAPTKGYVAVGFSPNGAMQGSDIILGWVDSNGQAHIKDLYGVGNMKPLEDETSNVELLQGVEKDDMTRIRFKRKWNTCDTKHDYKLTNDTVKLIWAYNEFDPNFDEVMGLYNFHYHTTTNRGVQNAYLKAKSTNTVFPTDDNNLDSNVQYFDIKVESHVVPGTESTTYSCFLMKYPHFHTKNHMIGWRPIIEDRNVANVHHFVVFECVVPNGNTDSVFGRHVGQVETCYNPNMPPTWAQYCWTVPIVWTLGQEGEMLPEHLGIPIGEQHGGASFFMFEVHYDNPTKRSFIDSSGIRVYHTTELREYDLTSATIGSRFTSFLFVPPGVESYNVVGGCTSECTSLVLPKEGIKATHVVLHAHKAARKVVLQHIRNGVELEPIAIDNNYDLNYQQARAVVPERQILPGDVLLTTCEYNTTYRKEPLYGDLTTEDSEMCHSFLFYYPKNSNFASCQYQSEFKGFINALGVDTVEGKVLSIVGLPYQPKREVKFEPHDEGMLLLLQNMSMNSFEYMNIVQPSHLRGSTVKDVIDHMPWSEKNGAVGKSFEKTILNGQYYAVCTGEGRRRIPLNNYITTVPTYEKYSPIDPTCSSASSIINTLITFITPLLLFMTRF